MKVTKKQIIWAIIIAIISALVIVFALTSGNDEQQTVNQNNSAKVNETETQNEEKALPVFTYFVTDADLADAKTNESIEALKKEYNGNVSFKICNIDEDATLLENFPIVKDNTPALIMLDANADITGILFKTNEYEKLKEEIEKVL